TYYIDRTTSGKTDFEKDFGKRMTAPRFSSDKTISLTLLVDVASAELFADNGLSVMTAVFFPDQPLTKLSVKSATGTSIGKLTFTKLTPSVQ
ncbi:GH32 C-terminal domain-containing protein, partial [Spirosoma sp.]|uniref:GH32 C-terminal domain-containing protein n=1 Tax=Spirosoma sp. TaxID=1899569 RepID=UPI003B3B316F